MTHTSQRRCLDPEKPGQEMVVLAIIPARHAEMEGIREAFGELAAKMLEYQPDNCMFGELMPDVALVTSTITAVYSDLDRVVDFIEDLKGDWLARNRAKGFPISVVLSGLFGDVHDCCQKTDCTEHTYLHSLGFFGRVEDLPSEDELCLMTMCGHGLVAAGRVRKLVERVSNGALTPAEAAEDLAKPCLCGIVNKARATEIFERLADGG